MSLNPTGTRKDQIVPSFLGIVIYSAESQAARNITVGECHLTVWPSEILDEFRH